MARIKMIDESDAEGPLADGYAKAKAQSPIGIVAPIIKTMSLRPDFLAAIQAASRMHFTDGANASPARDGRVVRLRPQPLQVLTQRAHVVPAVAGQRVRGDGGGAPQR